MKITKDSIVSNPSINGFLSVPDIVQGTIEGRACDVKSLHFLPVIADMLREIFPERFCYLEIGTLFGGSMCALSYHQRRSKIEKYAGIDIFSYYGEKIEPESGVEVSIERADRNIRYFGGFQSFALFEGRSDDEKIRRRAFHYLRSEITLLYIDGDHTREGAEKDFLAYAPHVQPGGVVVFDDYHNDDWPGVTEFCDSAEFAGWNVIGGLVPNVPTFFVIQKEA